MQTQLAIGVDLGGTNCRFGAVRSDGALEAVERSDEMAERSTAEIVSLTAAHVARLCEHARATGTAVAGVGFVMPGFLSDGGSRIEVAANLPKLVGADLPAQLRRACPLPIAFDADCHAAGIAEARLGAGRGVARLIVASIGTGIGASVLVGGAVLRFDRNGAGSLGHIIVAPDGPVCRCGKRGCLETMAAGPAIERHGIDRAAKHLAVGIATWSAIFRPERIVFCGGVSAIGRPLVDAIERELNQRMPSGAPELRIGTLGADAALVGAGLIAFDSATGATLPRDARPTTIPR